MDSPKDGENKEPVSSNKVHSFFAAPAKKAVKPPASTEVAAIKAENSPVKPQTKDQEKSPKKKDTSAPAKEDEEMPARKEEEEEEEACMEEEEQEEKVENDEEVGEGGDDDDGEDEEQHDAMGVNALDARALFFDEHT